MADSPPEFDKTEFSTSPVSQRIEKPWGFEVLLSPPGQPYVSKLIHVDAGKRLSLQIHDVKVETQTLLAGKGILLLEDSSGQVRSIEMKPGVGYHVAVGQKHRLCAAPDSFAEVFESSSPEDGITYRLEDDYARPHEDADQRRKERGG
ncbi:MAG: cupin [Chloroflexota bacterium]